MRDLAFDGTHVWAGLLLMGMLLVRPDTGLARKRLSAHVLFPVTVATCVVMAWAVFVPSYWLRAAEDAHLAGEPSLELYERALAHPWPNAEARKEYAFALSEAGRDADARRELERTLEGLDTGDAYLSLALLAAKRGDRESARRWGEECLRRWRGARRQRSFCAEG